MFQVSNEKREVVRLEPSKISHAIAKRSPHFCRRRKWRRRKITTTRKPESSTTPIPIDPRITIDPRVPPEIIY